MKKFFCTTLFGYPPFNFQAFTMTKWGRCYLKGDKRKDPSKNNNAVSGRMECFKEKLAGVTNNLVDIRKLI